MDAVLGSQCRILEGVGVRVGGCVRIHTTIPIIDDHLLL